MTKNDISQESNSFNSYLVFIVALLFAFSFLYLFVDQYANGNWTTLLTTSPGSGPMADWIEQDLGQTPYPTNPHDGQFSYIIARNGLNCGIICQYFDDPAYRIKRILYPLISGGGGYFSSKITFLLLISYQLIFFALAATYFNRILKLKQYSKYLLIFWFLSPGLLLSMRILNCEILAVALSFMAIYYFLVGDYKVTLLLLTLTILSKEVYFSTACSLACYELFVNRSWKKSLSFLFIPLVLPMIWYSYLSFIYGMSNPLRSNFTWPFVGIFESSKIWSLGIEELELVFFSLLVLILGLLLTCFSKLTLWSYLIIPWILIAICASSWIWIFGNNSVRSFTIIFYFFLLLIGECLKNRKLILDISSNSKQT